LAFVTGFPLSSTGSFVVPLLFAAVVGLVLGRGGFGLIVQKLDDEIGTKAFYKVFATSATDASVKFDTNRAKLDRARSAKTKCACT
jgi:hypothetical protein